MLPTSAAGDGSVTVPEHPEGASFNPNEIKDIKAADPGSAVNLIEAPSANNQGEARLTYPLEVPPGRNKVQPQLAVRYSSAGGNGWLGLGWDLPTSTITVDTRWGVPRYDAGLETENYLLDGEELTPVVNRTRLLPRTAEQVFHTRVESQFSRIVRHGSDPTNYWWEITDKSGTRSFFGGAPDTAGPTGDDTLVDGHGDIAVWAVREVRDTNDNFMRYHNIRVADGGVANATVPGSNLYVQRITYTGHGTVEGPYSVTFIRDRDRAEPRRPDVVIDARDGFKKVTADLLRRVEVKLGGQLVRAYELNYRTGAFDKTLLASVSQFGEDNKLFNTHTFDYYNDIQDGSGTYNAFSAATPWTVPDDHLGVGLGSNGEAGALSANTSQSAGGHLYVGYNPTGVSKSNSAGLKVGFNAGSTDGLLALADVNGDNLPDKVFRSGGQIFYRPNLSGPNGQPRFGDAIPLPNLPAISSESSQSGTVGIESYFGVAAQLDYVSTTTRSDQYFADVNGDGITDLVSNGSVLFGHLGANGQPTYSNNSADTPVPIGAGTVSGSLVGDQTAQFERQVDAFPLMDSVRRWVAPYDGTVRVDGAVNLVQDTSPQRAAYPKADGVRVTIQHNDTELWAQRIGPTDY
ncbi:MAG TPA: SpvB/TcaC N-terminal domain-containing protein, partial [Pseudonocardiaceae bacterium]